MAEIILHPCHPDYCKECIYRDTRTDSCKSSDYNRNSYKVNCVWHYCKYKKKVKNSNMERNEKYD